MRPCKASYDLEFAPEWPINQNLVTVGRIRVENVDSFYMMDLGCKMGLAFTLYLFDL